MLVRSEHTLLLPSQRGFCQPAPALRSRRLHCSHSIADRAEAPAQGIGAQQFDPPQTQSPHAGTSLSASLAADVTYDGIIAEVPVKPASLYVRVRRMVKHFNTAKGVFKAVDGVDVNVEPSTIVALLGPSGSGKTTLLRLVAGLETPTSGSILFDDWDATNTPVQDRQIGFVFQSYALFNHRTVAENIKFGLEVRGLKIDHSKRVADLLELVQLEGLGDRFPRQLSGGQRQRVALARALASNPRLLLLDEPFGALDAVVRKSLRSGLKEIVRSVGVTTIIVTHDQEEAFDLADKVVIFNRGRIEQQGSPNDIIKKPATPFIMKFVGETNQVPATAQVRSRGHLFLYSCQRTAFTPLHTMHQELYFTAVGDLSSHSHMSPHGPFWVRHLLCVQGACAGVLHSQLLRRVGFHTGKAWAMFRPSDMQISKTCSDKGAAAVVVERTNLGWTLKYLMRFDDDVEVEYSVARDQDERQYNFSIGQRIFVYVPPECIMGFEMHEIESAPLH
uniref:CysA-like protein n=1 Tax=Haematococcus lacustris TaxID=44745 RepID=A0A699ZS69_HAELA